LTISLLLVDFTDQIKEYFQQQLKRNLFFNLMVF